LEQLFVKFRRGVGLGLAICRAIVQLHGGRVWAEQLPGGGSAFRFALPLEAAPPVPLETAPA
jgi:two-component system sensor histidine kinase KdpD